MAKKKKCIVKMDKKFIALCWIFTIVVACLMFYLINSIPTPTVHQWQTPDEIINTVSCDDLESTINLAIEEANFCSSDNDCISVFFGCPFGCETYLNKGLDLSPLEDAIVLFKAECNDCMYKCLVPENPVCENGKCVKPLQETYVACGCGCCQVTDVNITCIYRADGDDLQEIIEADKAIAESPDCNSMGCSMPIIYTYCD